MTTRFRVGDVVRWPGCGGEYRVTEIVDTTCVRVDGLPGAEHTAGGGDPRVFVLLRRPLHIRDVLVHAASTARWTLTLDAEIAPNHWRRKGWTHEDGTPIDVEAPAVEAKAPQTAQRRAAEADIAAQNAYNQRANRLSDGGALASQNRELLAENATLRRDVERLTRNLRDDEEQAILVHADGSIEYLLDVPGGRYFVRASVMRDGSVIQRFYELHHATNANTRSEESRRVQPWAELNNGCAVYIEKPALGALV